MLQSILASDFADFLTNWYGILLFVLIDVAVALLIVVVTYRWFFKYFFDWIFAFCAAVVTSPVWLTVAAASKVHIIKTNEYASVLTTRFVAGKNGRTVALHSFTVTDAIDGNLTKLGKFLKKTGIEKLPALFDVLTFRTSFVGVKPLSVTDEKFIAEQDYDRFSARPGYVNPLLTTTDNEATYEEMFQSDKRYAEKGGFFTDVRIIFTALVRKIRGESNALRGEIAEKDYANVLLERGEITEEDYAEARAEEKYASEDEETVE